MLKIRLQRVGRKNDPSFRVVLTDSKNATRSGKFLEILGSYSARQGEPVLSSERVKYWMSVGAKPSNTVHNLLIKEKVISGKKINVLPKKTVPKKEGEEKTETVETAA
jgi:small subunit ribosomal protein S16